MKVMREEMNQQFNQILSLIQKNPLLAQVKYKFVTLDTPLPPLLVIHCILDETAASSYDVKEASATIRNGEGRDCLSNKRTGSLD